MNDLDNRWIALRARIVANADLLADQGSVILKTVRGRKYWALRFKLAADAGTHRRHATIHIGVESDQDLVARVRALLASFREPRHWADEVGRYAFVAASLVALLGRQHRRGRARKLSRKKSDRGQS